MEKEIFALNKMLTHLNGYRREAVLAPLFKMLEATFDLFVPLVMADIVNVGIAAHDLHYILVRCGILLLLAMVGLACSLTAQYFSAKAAVGYSTSLRHSLFEHIQKLGFTEMDTLGTSTLITRMTSDINQVQSGLNLFLRLFLRSPFVVFGAMIMAFTVNVRAAWIFVVAIPLLSIVVFGVMVITNPLYKTAQTRLDRVLGLTRENLTGVRVVRAFDKEQSEIDRFESANDLLTKMQLHVGHISSLMSPLTYVIINLAIVALLYVGSIEINIGGMASGDVIALVNYMNQILVELVKLANLIVQVSKALACASRVQAVLDTEPGMEFPTQLQSAVDADKADDAVRFDHVSLTYAGAGAPSLTDISFAAQNGQTIGVGAGQQSRIHCTRLAGQKADNWQLRHMDKVLNLPFRDDVAKPNRDNAIDVYIGDTPEDVIGDDVWAETFTEQPAPLTAEEKKEYLRHVTGVSLGSDAFFPFGDNIERARRSGVTAIVQPGGSIRDQQVIDTCNKYGIAMAFCGIRLFHH